jgi:hypothetical protein
LIVVKVRPAVVNHRELATTLGAGKRPGNDWIEEAAQKLKRLQ